MFNIHTHLHIKYACMRSFNNYNVIMTPLKVELFLLILKKKHKFLAEYNMLKPLMKKQKYHAKVIKNMEILFTLALYCT